MGPEDWRGAFECTLSVKYKMANSKLFSSVLGSGKIPTLGVLNGAWTIMHIMYTMNHKRVAVHYLS